MVKQIYANAAGKYMYHHTQAEETGLGETAAGRAYPQQNSLLAALPAAERERLCLALQQIYLPLGSVLYESGDTLQHVYFPTDCVVLLLHELHDGSSAGIATIGNEGAVGVELFTGGGSTTNRGVVQSPGFAFRLTTARLKQEFLRYGELFRVLLRCTQALIAQMAQTAACNRHHSVDQQLCRWLLMSLDRVSSNKLTMTHVLIANILGVRREGVTVAAGRLQAQGIINCQRGQITVLDRSRLEQRCCECYGVVKKETDRLLPRAPQTAPAGTVHLSGARRRARPVKSRSPADAIDLAHAESSVSKCGRPLAELGTSIDRAPGCAT